MLVDSLLKVSKVSRYCRYLCRNGRPISRSVCRSVGLSVCRLPYKSNGGIMSCNCGIESRNYVLRFKVFM